MHTTYQKNRHTEWGTHKNLFWGLFFHLLQTEVFQELSTNKQWNSNECLFSWAQYSAFCKPGSNLEPAKPQETGLSPCFCWYFPSAGWSEILGLLFWLHCMPVASQAPPVIICFVKVKTMYCTWGIPCSGSWKTSMDNGAPIWDDVIFGHKMSVKQLSLLLGKFSVSAIPSLKSQGYCVCHLTCSEVEGLWGKSPTEARAMSTQGAQSAILLYPPAQGRL